MPNRNRKRPHLFISGATETERYRSIRPNIDRVYPPEQIRAIHGALLQRQLRELSAVADEAKVAQVAAGIDSDLGLLIQFRSFPEIELAFDSLAYEPSKIELMNVKQVDNQTYATVFVPDGKLVHFEKLINDYVAERRSQNGRVLDHKALLNTITEIRSATFDELWTDATNALPESDEEVIWWEVWLPIRGDRIGVELQFRRIAASIGFQLAAGSISFPERTVLLMQGQKRQIQQSIMLLNNVAELRRAKETANFFDSLTPIEQRDWVDDFLQYVRSARPGSPFVCILDTGVNNGHPLLAGHLHNNDLHTIEPVWGSSDEHGHGTEMAGIALYGDLSDSMDTLSPVKLTHHLESVKLLRNNGGNNDKHHGLITIEAVSRPEISAPDRKRVFSMAVTAKDNRDQGRPSAWSATLDRLAVDYDNDNETPRLFIVSAGNINDNDSWMQYPNSNTTDSIHDPSQAWNILTVGAYTEKTTIEGEATQGFTPVAPTSGLSPFSTTSCTWDRFKPLKPDVVFEGGNAAHDGNWACSLPSLSLLTTNFEPHVRLLTTTNATSAATALCARFAAQLMAEYPDLWPETIRALIVHSAEWTEEMKRTFSTGATPKDRIKNLIRHCGFGVPDLKQAMWSMNNSLTLIIQETFQPFHKEPNKEPTTRDMHLHRLPWPIAELETLGATQVEMKVTLSYFIEPNPSARGFKGRYMYESHGLRFEVRRPTETEAQFRYRINQNVRDGEEGTAVGGADTDWLLGKKLRHLGSLHCDTWRGTAVELAQRGILAVYPSLGWWKSRKKLERYNKQARYALLISIKAPEVDVDLYNAIQNQIAIPVEA
jgi:subtilase family protein